MIKLRNDNFSLKLRIHLLEERQGLALRPGDSDAAKENVFRVNLDLRYKVFNLTLWPFSIKHVLGIKRYATVLSRLEEKI